MKVAIVYDRVNKWGGAERILLAIHEMFPEAPLYTSVYSAERAPWAKVFDVRTSFLQRLSWTRTHHEWLAPLMPIAFESFDFSGYDLVISVTSEAAKGIITGPQTRHICYCLTPTRYLWSGYETYFGDGLKRWISQPVVNYLRSWDKVASKRPDKIIAISKTVAGRIKKYYGRNAEVMYPPVELARRVLPLGSPMAIPPANKHGAPSMGPPDLASPVALGDYFIVVSRLVPYKRVDLAIRAFNKLGLPLVVVGIGSEARKLHEMAKSNIYFLGHLTDRALASYYEKATALIFPQEEDFGIVAVEAQLAGTPVIAYRGGGALETVIAGRTGEFFEEQSVNSLIMAVRRFNRDDYNSEVIKKHAQKFSKRRFIEEFKKILNE